MEACTGSADASGRPAFITPEMARARAKRELGAIAQRAGRDLRVDEFLTDTLFKLEAELLTLKIWRFLHGVTCGAVTLRDILIVRDAVERDGKTMRDAAIDQFPALRETIEEECGE